MAERKNNTSSRGRKLQPTDQLADDRLFCRGFLAAMTSEPSGLDPFTRHQAKKAAFAFADGDIDAPMAFALRYWRARGVNPRTTLGRRMNRLAGYLPQTENVAAQPVAYLEDRKLAVRRVVISAGYRDHPEYQSYRKRLRARLTAMMADSSETATP